MLPMSSIGLICDSPFARSPVRMIACPPAGPAVRQSMCWTVRPSVNQSGHVIARSRDRSSVCGVRRFGRPYVHLSVCPLVYLPVRLSIRLSVRPSV